MDSPMERWAAANQKRDWAGVRQAGEELLATLDAQAPPQVRRQLHYLIGDAIVASAAPSDSDLEAAVGHFQACISTDPSTANSAATSYAHITGYAHIQIGRAEIRRGKAGNASSLGRAVAAFEGAKSFFAEDTDPKLLAEAYTGIAEAHEELGQSDLEELTLALSAYKSAHRLYGRTDSKLNEGIVAFRIGRIQTRLFDLAGDQWMLRDALGYLEQAEGVYRAARQDAQHQDALRLLAHVKERLGQPEAEVDRSPPQVQPVPLAKPYKLMQRENGLSQAQFDQVMQRIRVNQIRRVYLRSWLDHHDSADLERAEFLCNHVILPLETETEAMRRAAQERRDAKLLNQAEQHASMVFEYGKYLITRDQERSTHAKAVELLRAHLDRGDEYVLFLRNFDLEITKGVLPKELERLLPHENYGTDLIQVQLTASYRCIPKEKFEESLARSCRVVEVSDIADVFEMHRSQGVSKLRVLSAEWKLVVSMLIGEAAAVVVFVQRLTDGLTREIELIERFESLEKTTVLMIKPDDFDGAFASLVSSKSDRNAKRLAFEVLPEALKRFEGRLAQVQQLTDSNTEEIVERIRSQVARTETAPETPD